MNHEKYMQRCLQLAANGLSAVSPNPMVGAVVVADDTIVGEGYHTAWGKPHAEVMAINSVKDPELLKRSTLYVSLEPCSHYGKTPPCSDLIIRNEIPEVVIACRDPFEKVDGSGIKKLEKAGVKVTTGIMEKEARFLNRRFFTFHEQKRPYIILKWAQSADGYLDKQRQAGEQGINWITQPRSRQLVHLWRSQEQAIAIGHNTLINDNPGLDTRLVEGRDPVKIVLSSDHDLTGKQFKAFTGDKPANIIEPGTEALIAFCTKQQLISVIVEGGAGTLNKFISSGLWDEARVFTGNTHFTDGLKAPLINSSPSETSYLGADRLDIYYRP